MFFAIIFDLVKSIKAVVQRGLAALDHN